MTSETDWEVPEPLSTHDVQVDDDTAITLRRHGNPDGPRLVLSHGNGLAIDLYYPFWSLLADDFDLILYDLRNHGWNDISSLQSHNIPTLVQDHDKIMDAIDLHYGDKPKVGIYHSVSALISLLSPRKGRDFAARVLFAPPLCKPGRDHREFEEAASTLSSISRSRMARFKNREDFAFLLSFFPVFELIVPGGHDLFAMTTLRENDREELYELCCPPEYEAQIIEYAGAFAVLVDFESQVCPTKVIGADPTLPFSYLPTLDLSDVFTVGYDFLPDATHFLQLEKPDQCVEVMLEFITPIIGR
ncbi:MAG: alpha/beta hydrolase [Chloroflexi bacterium]|nr:alpha/beta hydrolase [Chloroflexota bacterium]